MTKPRNSWATINYARQATSEAPPSKFGPAKPEVLPVESPEALAKRERDAEWLNGIMEACEEEEVPRG